MKKALLHIVLCTLIAGWSWGQDSTGYRSQFRALIVGVSKYKNLPEKKQLEYADDDAQALYDFLVSHQEIKKENVTLLLNEDASADMFRKELYMLLLRKAKPRDRVLIYFAGHGDVDSGIDDGFLLMHNVTDDGDYFIDDAVPVSDVQLLARQASHQGVKVLMVSDACRSGTLMGGDNGNKFTTQALVEEWENTAKLVSCQPNQLSFEGEQWGHGHGVFTYYLLKGLKGEADEDLSNYLTLGELYDFVKYKVKEETNRAQIPKSSGDDLFVILTVDKLLDSKSDASDVMEVYVPRDPWKIEVPDGANLSTGLDDLLTSFEQAIGANRLVRSGYDAETEPYASELYEKMANMEGFDMVSDYVRGIFNIALQKDAQDIIQPFVQGKRIRPTLTEVEKAIEELDYSCRMYSDEPFFQNKIKAKMLFLEGYEIIITNDVPKYDDAVSKFKQIMEYQPGASYPLLGLSEIYNRKRDYSGSKKALKEAIKKSPSWTELKGELGQVYKEICNCDFAEDQFNKIINLHPEKTDGYMDKANYKEDFGLYDEADSLYSKALDLDKDDASIYAEYGHLKGLMGEYGEAIGLFEKGIEVDEYYYKNYLNSGNLQLRMMRDSVNQNKEDYIETGSFYLGRALNLAPYEPETYNALGSFYLDLVHKDLSDYVGNLSGYTNSIDAEDLDLDYRTISSFFKRSLELDPYNVEAYAGMGWANLVLNSDTIAAENFFNYAVEISPSHRSYLNLHDFYVGTKQYKKAEKVLLDGLRVDERSYHMYIGLLEFYRVMGLDKKADKIINELKSVFPGSFLPSETK